MANEREPVLAFWGKGSMEGTAAQVDAEIERRGALRAYVAEGWERRLDGSRRSMGELAIEAETGLGAAALYALKRGIPLRDWNDGTSTPRVVIRVSET